MLLSVLRPVLVGLLICAVLGSLLAGYSLLAGIPWPGSVLVLPGPVLGLGLLKLSF